MLSSVAAGVTEAMSTVVELVDASIWSLVHNEDFGPNLSCVQVSAAVHGSLIRYELDGTEEDNDALDLIREAASKKEEVILAFTDNGCLYLKIGFDSFQSLRLDGSRMSPLWDMQNATPLDHSTRPQWVEISFAG